MTAWPGKRFATLPLEILADPDLTPGEKLVLMAIANRHGENGRAWPGNKQLREDTGTLSRPTVWRAIRELERRGLLVRHSQGRGQVNVYQVRYPALSEAPPAEPTARLTVRRDPAHSEARNYTHELNQETKPKRASSSNGRAKRKRDEIWDTVVELWDLDPVTKREKTRVGALVRDFKEHKTTPAEIRLRAERYQARWPEVEFTADALLKHWRKFAKDATNGKRKGKPDLRSNKRYEPASTC